MSGTRVDAQFEQGLLDEIRGLLARGVPETRAAVRRARVPSGARAVCTASETRPSTRELIARENRHYARRQLIWFRKEPNLVWLQSSGENPETLNRRRSPAPVTQTVAAPFSRIIVIVLDSVGAGALEDAGAYGDEGSNTLGQHRARGRRFAYRRCARLGLDRIVDIGGTVGGRAPRAAIGRMAEASAGKDSVTGHWEMMGIVLDRAFPVFPSGFPRELHRRLRASGSAAARWATTPPRARRSSMTLAPSTCAPASRLSTRRPTACFRLRRTRMSFPSTISTG